MILKLSELRVVTFSKLAKEIEKAIVTLWILSTKHLFTHSVTRWPSLYPSLPRTFQMYPASHLYFMSIDTPTVF